MAMRVITLALRVESGCRGEDVTSSEGFKRSGFRLRSDFKFIAHAPHGLYVSRMRRVRLDLLAQPPHMNRYRTVVAVEFKAPHLIEQLGAREDLPGMACQEPQQIKFFGGQG